MLAAFPPHHRTRKLVQTWLLVYHIDEGHMMKNMALLWIAEEEICIKAYDYHLESFCVKELSS